MGTKIAIPATSTSPAGDMDQRFGRAAAFLILDMESGEWVSVDNHQEVAAAHGAGIRAAQLLVDRGVSVVLTADCGPKASDVLKAAGIEVLTGYTGSVENAVRQYKESQN